MQAFFLGYMVNRLLLCSLGRRAEDDRDHYANKRLDLGGPLLAALFRQLFRKLTKDVKTLVQAFSRPPAPRRSFPMVQFWHATRDYFRCWTLHALLSPRHIVGQRGCCVEWAAAAAPVHATVHDVN